MARKILRKIEDKVAIRHTAILVIDMQNSFFAENSTLGDVTEKRSLIPRLQKFLARARAMGLTLVFVRMYQTDDDASVRMTARRSRRKAKSGPRAGSWGAEFLPEFQPQAGDIVIEKTKFNAFLNTPLDARLRNRGIATLIVTGVYTNVCVGTTAQAGSMLNYHIVVPKDLVVGTEENVHESTLLNIDRWFGTVTSSDELLQIWEGKHENPNNSLRSINSLQRAGKT